MGLSSSGGFQVSRDALTASQMQLSLSGAPADCPADCPDNCNVQTASCTPATPTTVVIGVSPPASSGVCDVTAVSGQCGSVDVTDPRFCKSACHQLVVGMLAACEITAPNVAQQMQQFVDTCSGH